MEENNSIKKNLIEEIFYSLFDSNNPAVFYNNKIYSYEEILTRASSLSNGLRNKYGIEKNDKIIVRLDNSIEFIYCYLAALFGGFTIIPLDILLGEKDYKYIQQIVEPKLVIEKKEQLIFSNDTTFAIKTEIDSIFAIFFTSGTTGVPKGVCHSFSTLLDNAVAFNKYVGFDRNIRMLHVMPMGYMAGFLNTLLSPFASGASIVIAPKFNFSNVFGFWEIAIKNNVNAIWLSPTMASLLSRLSREKREIEWVKNNIKYVFVGTAPLSKKVFTEFKNKFGLDCLESYGMTEALIIATNTLNHNKYNSVGKILPGVKVKSDRLFNKKSINNKIFIKSNYMCLKYYLKGEELDSSDGWFPTGDLGYLDRDDNLFISGREKDLIIHGGMNISPINVQDCLLEMKEIDDAVVVGKPHEFWGEEVIAFLKLNTAYKFDYNRIISHCKKRLNSDSVPSKLIKVDEIPFTSTGKPQKYKLINEL